MNDANEHEEQPEHASIPIAPRYIPEPRPARRGSSRGLLSLVLFGLLMMSLCLNFGSLAGSPGAMSSGNTMMREEVVESGDSDSRILLLRVEGAIMNSAASMFGGPATNMVKAVTDALEHATDDDSIKAVLLRVDSPGGGVTESDEIYDALLRFKRDTKKPVIVSMGGICASGGYYISAPADKIFAQQTTITGSIGVLMSGMNYSGLMERYGVSDVTITSGPNKALMNPSRPVEPEHLAILQSTVDDMYERFVSIVAAGRNLTRAQIDERALADGRVFTASKAKELGLVDEIGYLRAAIEEARGRTSPTAAVIELKAPMGFFERLQASFAPPTPLARLERLLPAGPRYYYLWRP